MSTTTADLDSIQTKETKLFSDPRIVSYLNAQARRLNRPNGDCASDAEDAYQHLSLALLQGVRRYDSFDVPLACKIIKNAGRKLIRQSKAQKRRPNNTTTLDDFDAIVSDPKQTELQIDLRNLIDKVRYPRLLTRVIQGWSVKDAADDLAISRNEANVQLREIAHLLVAEGILDKLPNKFQPSAGAR